MINDIHITLEVKTFFGNSTLTMGLSTESSHQKPGVLTDSRHRHHQKREKEETCTQQLKEKLERLRSTRLTHCDQPVRLLDMQRF
jgi:hypothetical protein